MSETLNWHTKGENGPSPETMDESDLETRRETTREAIRTLSDNLDWHNVHAAAVEAYAVDDVGHNTETLHGALIVIRPLVEAKLHGNVCTPEEAWSGLSHAMLDSLLELRWSASHIETLPAWEDALDMLRSEFGSDVTASEVSWLQYEGLLTLAEAAQAYVATGDPSNAGSSRVGAPKRNEPPPLEASNAQQPRADVDIPLEITSDRPTAQPGVTGRPDNHENGLPEPADEELNDYVLDGQPLKNELSMLRDTQIRRVLGALAGSQILLESQAAMARYTHLNDQLRTVPEEAASRSVPFLTIDTPPWGVQAACRWSEPDLFFPEKGGSVKEAKRICSQCGVRQACLDYALEHDERFGIWGGLSERERRNIRRLRTAS